MTNEIQNEIYQEAFNGLVIPAENGSSPIMIYDLPKEVEKIKDKGLSVKEFSEFILQDPERRDAFISDKYFTSNLMVELDKEGSFDAIEKIKKVILDNAPASEFEYVFTNSFLLGKTTKDEPKIVYPENLPDDAVKSIQKLKNNQNFVTLIMGDSETGLAWGEVYDIKGTIGVSAGNKYEYPLLVSFSEEYSELHTMTNSEIKKFLEEEFLNYNDVLSLGGSLIGDNIVAIKEGFQNGKGVVYKHENFTPAYDIENAKVNVVDFEEKTIITNKSTGEEETQTKEYVEYQLVAKNNKTEKDEIIFKADSIDELQKELSFQYELALLNPKNANAEKKIVIEEENEEISEEINISEGKINDIDIPAEVEYAVGWSITDREDFIDDLKYTFIPEAYKADRKRDLFLMEDDLEFLNGFEDDYMLQSQSTNDYLLPSDLSRREEFLKISKEMICKAFDFHFQEELEVSKKESKKQGKKNKMKP